MTLEGCKVLVTGGAGFIGSHIIDLLVGEGCADIVALDNLVRGRVENLAPAMARGPVRLVEGDIRDRDLLDGLVAGCDVVFHQAALRITHCAEDPRAGFEVMAEASFDLIESCIRHRVRRLVAASSASVYGLAERFPTEEDHHPYDNRTFYGAAKMFLEGMLRSYHAMSGLDYVALRYFNVYGPRMDIHGKYTEVLVRWMDRLRAGQPPLIFGDGHQTMDFVHVADVARANLLAAKAAVSDRVYNVARGEGNVAARPCPRLGRGHGTARPEPGIRPRTGGQSGAAPSCRHRQGRSRSRLHRPDRPGRGPARHGPLVGGQPRRLNR